MKKTSLLCKSRHKWNSITYIFWHGFRLTPWHVRQFLGALQLLIRVAPSMSRQGRKTRVTAPAAVVLPFPFRSLRVPVPGRRVFHPGRLFRGIVICGWCGNAAKRTRRIFVYLSRFIFSHDCLLVTILYDLLSLIKCYNRRCGRCRLWCLCFRQSFQAVEWTMTSYWDDSARFRLIDSNGSHFASTRPNLVLRESFCYVRVSI